MIDRDLAKLYRVETKQLKRQVRRNKDRFPEDFMFEMTIAEFTNWRSQFGTSNDPDKMGLRYRPFCFTEMGVAMLSSVLNSRQAIRANIRIMRVFSRMREVLLAHKDIMLKLEQLEKQVIRHDGRMTKFDGSIQLIFEYLKQLINPPVPARKRIGFKFKREE